MSFQGQIHYEVHRHQVDTLLSAIEQTLMGHNLFVYLTANMQPYVRARAAARFRNEGDDASGPWNPLQMATQEIRAHQGFPRAHPINKRTGELEDFMLTGVIDQSFTNHWASMKYPGKSPTTSVAEKYATAQRGKNAPLTEARPVLAVNMADMAYFYNNFVFWFGREVRTRFRP